MGMVLVYFIASILVVGLVIGILLARAFRSGKQKSDPVCGKCGYIVRGISTLTCPECGSDLREVGIIAPKK